jgi:hypothetical protein
MSIMNSVWAYLVSKPGFVVAICIRHKASVLAYGPVFRLAVQNMVTKSSAPACHELDSPVLLNSFIGYLTMLSVTRLHYGDHMKMNEYGAVSEMRIGRGNRSIRIPN